MLTKSRPEIAKEFYRMAQENADARYKFYQYMAERQFTK